MHTPRSLIVVYVSVSLPVPFSCLLTHHPNIWIITTMTARLSKCFAALLSSGSKKWEYVCVRVICHLKWLVVLCKKLRHCSSLWVSGWVGVSNAYLFWLVGIWQRYHHPDDVEVGEGSAGGEGAGEDGCLAPGHLNTALGHRHVQGPYAHCKRKAVIIGLIHSKHQNNTVERAEQTTKHSYYNSQQMDLEQCLL